MKKTLGFGALTAIIIGVLVALQVGSKEHDDTAEAEPAFTMTCDEIVQNFLDDELGSTTKYSDQVVQVSGPIFEIEKNDGKVTAIKISSDEFYIVSATFQNPVDEGSISSDQITVKGVCSGFLGDTESMLPGGTVELKRSAIVTTN